MGSHAHIFVGRIANPSHFVFEVASHPLSLPNGRRSLDNRGSPESSPPSLLGGANDSVIGVDRLQASIESLGGERQTGDLPSGRITANERSWGYFAGLRPSSRFGHCGLRRVTRPRYGSTTEYVVVGAYCTVTGAATGAATGGA